MTYTASITGAQPAPAAPVDFDTWMAHPYTKVMQESIAKDYVPRADCAPAAQPADSAMTAEQIEALAHRTAWRYVHGSSNPNDSANSEYTFNRAQLLEFARALVAKETPHAAEDK